MRQCCSLADTVWEIINGDTGTLRKAVASFALMGSACCWWRLHHQREQSIAQQVVSLPILYTRLTPRIFILPRLLAIHGALSQSRLIVQAASEKMDAMYERLSPGIAGSSVVSSCSHKSVSKLVSQSVIWSVSQSVSQSFGRSVSQSFSQSFSQPVNKSTFRAASERASSSDYQSSAPSGSWTHLLMLQSADLSAWQCFSSMSHTLLPMARL